MKRHNVITAVDLGAFLRRGARALSRDVLLADRRAQRTGTNLATRAERLSVALQALGVNTGDRVLICLSNRVEMIESYWAVIQAGGIAVPVSALRGLAEAAEIATRAGTSLAITERTCLDLLQAERRLTGIVLDLRDDVRQGWIDYERAIVGAKQGHAVEVGDEDPCALAYERTYGTGELRGGVRTHRAVSLTGVVSALLTGTEGNRLVVGLPLDGRTLETVLFPTLARGVQTYLEETTDPEAFLSTVSRWQATAVLASVTMTRAVAARLASHSHSGVLSPLQWSVLVDPTAFAEALALANTLPSSSSGVMYQFVLGSDLAGHVCGNTTATESRSHPWPTVALAIAVNGTVTTTPEVTGELVVQSPQVSAGLWEPEQTASAFATGWFNLGARGKLTETGFVPV